MRWTFSTFIFPKQKFIMPPSSGVFARFITIPSGRWGMILAVAMFLFVLFGSLVTPYDPNKSDYSNKLSAPSSENWLGTDSYGRDQFTRLVDGGKRSLGAALIILFATLSIGIVVGIVSGMAKGVVDKILMRFIDILLALPSQIFALAIVGVFGVSFQNLLLAMIGTQWALYAKLSRSYVLTAFHRHDVIADRLAGIGWFRIVRGHIFPTVFSQIFIVGTLDLGSIIITIAGLSFLGLGVQPPYAEWGAMLSQSRIYFAYAPWLLIAPSIAIFITVVSANLIGNALRDASDPKNKL